MNNRQSDTYYSQLERRLRALEPLVTRLLGEQAGSYREYLDAGEYGLAVEVVAEQLTVDMPSDSLRPLAIGLLAEAELMRLPDSVAVSLRQLTSRTP